jgi:3-hydroxyacyl-CoA dehydrogenase/enoyl-CoA hydratase/3-hydroxybutyryl-CoA epimerase
VLTTEIRPDGVALLRIDVPGKSQNVVPPSIAVELEGTLRAVASDARAVVLASAKPGSWIAGADLDAFRNCESEEEVVTLCRQAQNALNMLEKFELPVVAAIDGMCLGGGLEVALACHARIAADSPLTRLALPEVQLGLIPAAGGTQRLPELVGLEASLDLLLSGRRVDGREALQMELVDEVVPPSILVEVACKRALERASSSGPRNRSLADSRR